MPNPNMIARPKMLGPAKVVIPKYLGLGVVARLRCESDIVTTCIPKNHSFFFLLTSNFSEEIIYKIAHIKVVKRTISHLHMQYFSFPIT